ncbi:response regulator [Oscillatoria sp. CS-180]|uniref:response regulator n=1 Tax=Oscillatoria sp. CS-180 TaxID=3021720 RepID=UPI00232F3AB9|nr:response regulator [Oscillatoria sp. CS-180]MDB9525260.1 response regulator [Oscillatoria sp. CS-180]
MMPEQQQRILGYFIEEAKDHLNTIEQGLLNLQATIQDSEMMNEVFRAAHSVKGGAAMLSLGSIQRTSHRLEDYFKALKDAPGTEVDRDLETMFLQVFDGLQALLEELQGPFGLTEDKAQEIMADVEPVFERLENHLNHLVAHAAPTAEAVPEILMTAPVAEVLVPQAVSSTGEESALKLVFSSDIPSNLREMLTLFKQPDTEVSRTALQLCCDALKQTGEQFDLNAWCQLVTAVRRAVGNSEQSYRSLAPVVIKELKRAQEQVLSGQAVAIAISSDLESLIPLAIEEESFDDVAALLDEVAVTPTSDADLADLFETEPVAEVTGTDTDWLELSSADSSESSDLNADDLLTAFSNEEPTSASGRPTRDREPAVGAAELNSLADLFEGEVSGLGSPWEEMSETDDVLADSISPDIDISDDFSDLLDTASGEEETQQDLADLFGDAAALEDPADLLDGVSEDFGASDEAIAETDFDDLLSLPETETAEAEAEATSEVDDLDDLLDDLPDDSSDEDDVALGFDASATVGVADLSFDAIADPWSTQDGDDDTDESALEALDDLWTEGQPPEAGQTVVQDHTIVQAEGTADFSDFPELELEDTPDATAVVADVEGAPMAAPVAEGNDFDDLFADEGEALSEDDLATMLSNSEADVADFSDGLPDVDAEDSELDALLADDDVSFADSDLADVLSDSEGEAVIADLADPFAEADVSLDLELPESSELQLDVPANEEATLDFLASESDVSDLDDLFSSVDTAETGLDADALNLDDLDSELGSDDIITENSTPQFADDLDSLLASPAATTPVEEITFVQPEAVELGDMQTNPDEIIESDADLDALLETAEVAPENQDFDLSFVETDDATTLDSTTQERTLPDESPAELDTIDFSIADDDLLLDEAIGAIADNESSEDDFFNLDASSSQTPAEAFVADTDDGSEMASAEAIIEDFFDTPPVETSPETPVESLEEMGESADSLDDFSEDDLSVNAPVETPQLETEADDLWNNDLEPETGTSDLTDSASPEPEAESTALADLGVDDIETTFVQEPEAEGTVLSDLGVDDIETTFVQEPEAEGTVLSDLGVDDIETTFVQGPEAEGTVLADLGIDDIEATFVQGPDEAIAEVVADEELLSLDLDENEPLSDESLGDDLFSADLSVDVDNESEIQIDDLPSLDLGGGEAESADLENGLEALDFGDVATPIEDSLNGDLDALMADDAFSETPDTEGASSAATFEESLDFDLSELEIGEVETSDPLATDSDESNDNLDSLLSEISLDSVDDVTSEAVDDLGGQAESGLGEDSFDLFADDAGIPDASLENDGDAVDDSFLAESEQAEDIADFQFEDISLETHQEDLNGVDLGEPEEAITDDSNGGLFDDLDTLLAEPSAADHEVQQQDGQDSDAPNFDELEDLLNDDLLEGEHSDMAVSSAATDEGGAADFAELDALLDEDESIAIASDDVGDVDAVDAVDAVDEFSDLEKLLEEADQSLGVGPSMRSVGSTRSARRVSGIVDQTMRVSVKHLDNLNNLVGELVVNRNSLEQDQDRLRQFLDNLLFQAQQLNDVGQRMRDLYERSLLESSLLASRQAFQGSSMTRSMDSHGGNGGHATGATFDALEMDRFTGFHTLTQEMIELIVRVRESTSDIAYTVESTDQIARQFRQVTTQLQEGLNKARMVPFAQTADRLPRAVRDISIKCGKEARLVVEGRDTLIDKMILERLYDPMTHLVNNAITHGIEMPEERAAVGKPREGKITIRAFYQGNQTVIYIADDGAGINPDVVKRKAIQKGILTQSEARAMNTLETYELLFRHGFSTRDKADDFAGRGVGMDVVRTALSEIRGSITIDSDLGRGTSFTIRLPLTLSISKALSCLNNQARIAFPMDGVEDMFDIPKERVRRDQNDQTYIQWRDTSLIFQPLSDLLQFNRSLGRNRVYGGSQDEDMISIVVLRNASTHIGIQVDRVLGEQEIVIKQIEGPVPKPMGIAGATVLGDGRVMPIGDVLELIDIAQGRVRREAGSSLWSQVEQPPLEEVVSVKAEPTVLIVDDSITVRELLSMSFNKVGYRVEQARDGQEAWEKLRSGLPCDLVFCDIEMPRMDGLELLSRMQKDSILKRVPIAMLTSRGADRHRQMAVDLGASGYFTKPYLEEALLDAAQRMLKGEVLLTKQDEELEL